MGLLSCTFGDAAARDAAAARDRVKPHTISLLPEFSAPAHVFSTLIPLALQTVPHMYVMVADSASTVHATGDSRFIYNQRTPAPGESSLVVGDGRSVPVKFYGDLDVVFYSERRSPIRITTRNIAVVLGLKIDPLSLNKVQEAHSVFMDHTGTYTLRDEVHFTKFPTGNYIAPAWLEQGGDS